MGLCLNWETLPLRTNRTFCKCQILTENIYLHFLPTPQHLWTVMARTNVSISWVRDSKYLHSEFRFNSVIPGKRPWILTWVLNKYLFSEWMKWPKGFQKKKKAWVELCFSPTNVSINTSCISSNIYQYRITEFYVLWEFLVLLPGKKKKSKERDLKRNECQNPLESQVTGK